MIWITNNINIAWIGLRHLFGKWASFNYAHIRYWRLGPIVITYYL